MIINERYEKLLVNTIPKTKRFIKNLSVAMRRAKANEEKAWKWHEIRRIAAGREPTWYDSREWFHLRHRVILRSNGKCKNCGATSKSSNGPMNVDHIKPRWKYPELEYDINNLQVLCRNCNKIKGGSDPSNITTTPLQSTEDDGTIEWV